MGVQGQLKQEGHAVSMSQLCRWFGMPRRTVYYRPASRAVVQNPVLKAQVFEALNQFPTYGYRRLAVVLGSNEKPVQRILQLNGWQVRKRPAGKRPRAQAMPSVSAAPNQRWATDTAMVWCGRDLYCHLSLVVDCCTREILSWRLAKRGNAQTVEATLEEALIERFGCLGRVTAPLILRSDNGLVFSSKRFTSTVKAYGLTQEFITPYTPQQNGLVERLIRSIKEECIWLNNFKDIQHAKAQIAAYVRFYNSHRPHQALGYKTPKEVFIGHPLVA